jgi:hypothetical protein
MVAGRFKARDQSGGLLSLAGVVSVALPAIERKAGRKKTAMLSGADTADLWSFEPPLSRNMPDSAVHVKRASAEKVGLVVLYGKHGGINADLGQRDPL